MLKNVVEAERMFGDHVIKSTTCGVLNLPRFSKSIESDASINPASCAIA
jgi:hypothetical protein